MRRLLYALTFAGLVAGAALAQQQGDPVGIVKAILWTRSGAGVVTSGPVGIGTTSLRDNSGTLEFKNPAGAWTPVPAATASAEWSRVGTVLGPTNAGDSLSMTGAITTTGTVKGRLTIRANGVLAGTLTLLKTDAVYQTADPTAADRDVSLPAVVAGDAGQAFCIKHVGAAHSLVVKDSGGTTIVTLAAGDARNVIYDGSAWIVL